MSLNGDLARAIETALTDAANEGVFAPWAVTVRRQCIAELELEGLDGPLIAVIYNAAKSKGETFDGVEQTLARTSVILSHKPDGITPDDVEPLIDLLEQIWREMVTRVDPQRFTFSERETDPLYDHEKLRIEGIFHAETVWDFSVVE